MEDWYNAGSSSAWTLAVKSAVIKLEQKRAGTKERLRTRKFGQVFERVPAARISIRKTSMEKLCKGCSIEK